MLTEITKKNIYNTSVHSFSSQKSDEFRAENVFSDNSCWISEPKSKSSTEYLILELDEEKVFNYIEIKCSKDEDKATSFPKSITILSSNDMAKWNVLSVDNDIFIEKNTYKLQIPVYSAKYIKILIPGTNLINDKYFIHIQSIEVGISGINTVSGSKHISKEFGIKNIFDGKNDTWFETNPSTNIEQYHIDIDLGEIYQIGMISMSSAGNDFCGFPKNFTIETSIDQKIWTIVLDQKNFSAVGNETYLWNINNLNSRYIRIEMNGSELENDKHGIRLKGMEIFTSSNMIPSSSVPTENIPYATVFQPGIVRLAKDDESTRDSVVRSSDIRLKNASTIFQGIVKFAKDGETGELIAVQASDTRLKPANDISEGIVRLAYDRESKAGIAVQASDSRLQEATDKSFGIVKLCPNGEYSEIGVVKGNDVRLKNSTIHTSGIVQLADNEGTEPNTVVQANDNRLKDATTLSKGVVQFAENNEVCENKAVQANDHRLKPATTNTRGVVELAENGEDSEQKAVQGNDNRLKMATTETAGIIELAENGEDRPRTVVQGNDNRLRNASTKNKGIMRFADDREKAAEAALQSNDSRINPATTVSPGIVQFAKDGDNSELTAVQGNDKRLKPSTTISKGIVELAEDGEDKEGVVVQGNDSRLKDADTKDKGILRFAENNETSAMAAVQSNDDRLRDATETIKGIMKFADDGSDKAMTAVQGNDKRLKDATETSKGIMKFASDGSDQASAAVQGNDKRLKNATTIALGIVELAENGEDKEGVAVQGNDERLKKADENNYGIVKFAKDEECRNDVAVQGNDKRLSNARKPLPHEHDYAPKEHDFSSHIGNIDIDGKKNQFFQGITPPPVQSAVINAKNTGSNGAIGINGVALAEDGKSKYSYGVSGHSSFVGVRGQSSGLESEKEKGCGILGISRFGAGGVFASEHNYSLIVDGFGNLKNVDDSIKLNGEGKAIAAYGKSSFNGQVFFENDEPNNLPANMVEMFSSNETDYISAGDILIIDPENTGKLGRTQTEYDTKVCGVVSGNPSIIFNNELLEYSKLYPIALSGKVKCKVDARSNPINPGDLIVTSSTPGCGMKGKVDSFDKIGSVIGKALSKLEDGIDTIDMFIYHS